MYWPLLIFITTLFIGSGCSARPQVQDTAESSPSSAQSDSEEGAKILTLPELQAAELDGRPLKVIATTSIIGDVVEQVGGEAIELTTLIEPGQDPHGYQPAARDLTAVATADLIFINGWDLEEALVQDLQEIGQAVPIVPISAGIEPLSFGENKHQHDEEVANEHGDVDPHVWFRINNVQQWTKNAQQLLSALDPANAQQYAANADRYVAELGVLETDVEEELAQIPEDKRFLVTNHDSLAYFADAYDFTVIGTVIPAASTLAEPSATDLAQLIAEMETHGLCTIFTDAAVSDTLAQTITAELEGCEEIKILQLYSGGLGPPGSGADSYTAMIRANVDTILEGLD